jgi:glucose-1-phosphate thymidylyltransferase
MGAVRFFIEHRLTEYLTLLQLWHIKKEAILPFTVLLTTSGTGSRLGELTKNTNKCLIPIQSRPAIDYIFDTYPEDTDYVVTLGYLGQQVRDYLTQNYPERSFLFVTVDKYQGDGSSLGYSMLAAKDQLQKPFIFHACDTIIKGSLPEPTRNWAAGYHITDNAQYRTHNIKDGKVILINDKGAPNFDYIHIGLIGVYDFVSFWDRLSELYQQNPSNQALNDTDAINAMLNHGHDFDFVPVDAWYDTGNPEALRATALALSRQE